VDKMFCTFNRDQPPLATKTFPRGFKQAVVNTTSMRPAQTKVLLFKKQKFVMFLQAESIGYYLYDINTRFLPHRATI
jgi:hypothetical protein